MKINNLFKKIPELNQFLFNLKKLFIHLFLFEYIDVFFKVQDQNLNFRFQILFFQLQFLFRISKTIGLYLAPYLWTCAMI